MNSPDDFPLDAFGMEHTTSLNPRNRQRRDLSDLVSAVIAMDHSAPVRPQKNSWQVISVKISSKDETSRSFPIPAWLGWVAAAVIATYLLIDRSNRNGNASIADQPLENTIQMQPSDDHESHEQSQHSPQLSSDTNQNQHRLDPSGKPRETNHSRDPQRSLIQEIDILRKQIAVLASRDAERLVPQQGVAWPIIMKLTVPGTDPAAAEVPDPLLGSMLRFDVDDPTLPALSPSSAKAAAPTRAEKDPSLPSAVPIYDPARDTGLLVISNLDQPAEDKAYHLWVESDTSTQPVLVGTLPEHVSSSENFAFKLGAVGIIPDRFLVTQDSRHAPESPNKANTVLLGPSPKP
ncbi:MAG: hypothetical protein ACOVRB_00890 [Akkermansiaceae bacterium]